MVRSRQLEEYIQPYGPSCMLFFAARDQEKKRSQAFRSLFLQETIKRGVLMPSLTVSYSHSDEDIDRTIEAIDQSLIIYRAALENGVENYLVGEPSRIVQRRYNRRVA